jgi:uncharacterized YccA/Bax inhibitor family protein
VRTTNPVLTRLGADAARERAARPEVFGQHTQSYPTDESVLGTTAPPDVRPMTIDDVVVRTVGLIGLTTLSAGFVWTMVPQPTAMALVLPAILVGVGLGLVIGFKRITNPLAIGAYAVIMGGALGAVSELFEARFPGIVMNAVIATMGVFLGMGLLYKIGAIRATPKFIKFMVAALAGAAVVIVINFGYTLITGEVTPLRDGGPLAIIVSLVLITIAALSFILSFHEAEEGARVGMPQRYAWLCAFGILVSLVWLYIEMLRFLSYFQGD